MPMTAAKAEERTIAGGEKEQASGVLHQRARLLQHQGDRVSGVQVRRSASDANEGPRAGAA